MAPAGVHRGGDSRLEQLVCPGLDSACCLILDNINEGVFAVDCERRITSCFNRAAARITGFTAQEAIGQFCFDILRADICQTSCPLERTFATGEGITDVRATIITKDGREIPVSVNTALIRDPNGDILGGIETIRDLSVLETLRREIAGQQRLGDLIGKSRRMQEIFEILPDIAESDSTILLHGPSGSGKGLLAATIHDLSPRRGKPFVKINCGAIPDPLLESELFGYKRGAFTDARRDKPGRLSLAAGGTLLLDEVDATSPALQVKLLRVLEEKRFFPLGATAPAEVDVRIIAASKQDIETLVAAGKFRDDLYYRLNVIKIELPPLRERREDIPLLVPHILQRLNSFKAKAVGDISTEVMARLLNYDYPGNIRELENILEHAHVLCRGPTIELQHLPAEFLEKTEHASRRSAPPLGPLEVSEAEAIRRVLVKHGGSRLAAARELGMSRTTLWRKIRRYGLA